MVRRVRVDPGDPTQAVLDEAVAVLAQGGVVAFPTETFYGLAVDVANPEAIEKVFAIKGRQGSKALPWIAADVEQLMELAELSGASLRLAKRFWPGPLTLVVPRTGGGTVAARVSGLPLARALAARLGRPITATSANVASAPPAETAEALESLEKVDLVLDGGPTPGGLPSTIVDMTHEGATLLRQGAVDFRDVEQVLAESRLIG